MKRLFVIVFFGTVLIFLNGAVSHLAAGTAGYKTITAPEVKNMMEKGNVVVVHVLSKIVYDIQHLPGSINIPINKMETTDKLPEDKNKPLIFYCMGEVWPYSVEAARIAVKKGYTDVYAFIGGIPEWREFHFPMIVNEKIRKIRTKKISPKRLLGLMKEKDIYILDVRPGNFKRDQTFIKGAVHCPLIELSDRCNETPKDRQIVITDWHMKQSISAAKFLIAEGYTVIGVLKGGIKRWKSEGLPLERRE